ncbi:MAG: hypothetical protein J6J75_04375, partial [Alistipes sp.]|nr:hypothetical protein [Alistipes sp.]
KQVVCTLKGRFSTYLPILSILKNTTNTQLYILGCKIGCLFYNLLIFSIYCGEGGKKFVLDNGDEVTKNDGLFGDGRYYSTTGSGKVYSSSDERTFREE